MKLLTRVVATGVLLAGMLMLVSPGIAGAEQASDAESEAGFVPLFADDSLEGWHGNTTAWILEDGLLSYTAPDRPSGSKALLDLKLMSPAEYSDFVLRFEFKLEKSANNGVAIRAPLEGDPAFVGMEIQVIDTPNWKNLKPFQVHGSIYGVVAAKTGHLNEPGQWNREEIFCQGRHIRVTLNGAVIVDTNLDEIGDKTLDQTEHPGVRRSSGHIGFLGHTGKAEYRNIRIKDLTKGNE